MTFGQLWKLFNDESNSFTDIANQAGLTRERVSKLYKKYFAEFLGAKGRYERVRLAQAKKNKVASQTFSDNDITSRIARVALKHGLSVTRLAAENQKPSSPEGFLQKRLVINSRVCLIYNPASAYAPYNNHKFPYARVVVPKLTLSKSEFVLIRTTVAGHKKRVFIIPSEEIRRISLRSNSKVVHLYIPLKRISSSTLRPKIDYWRYEDAWQLFKQPTP